MRLFIHLLFILFSSVVLAQGNIEFESSNFPDQKKEFFNAKQSVLKGNLHFKNEDYFAAQKSYLKAHSFNPENALLNFKLGLCYFKLGDDSLAMFSFEKALRLESNVAPDIHYYLAVSQHLNSRYLESLVNYKIALDSAKKYGDADYISSLNKRIKECDFALKLLVDTTIEVSSLDFNTDKNESSVHISPSDSLMYVTSERTNNYGVFSEDVYLSSKDSGDWGQLIDIGKPINTIGNDAVLGVHNSILYLYSDINNGDIFVSNKNNGSWSKPKPLLGNVNSEAKETSLSIYEDSVLFFVSNRSGNKDIYQSKKENNSWGKPIALSSDINTGYDEESPIIINDTLYFASQGHNSIGGYDIFKSFLVDNKWSRPVNVGFPINSPYDDLYYTNVNGERYFVSDRMGGKGGADVFVIKPIERIIEIKDSLALDTVNNSFADTISIDSSEIRQFAPVYFGFDDFAIKDESVKKLNEIRSFLKQNPNMNIIVEGHTDCVGSSNYNMRLSEKRAQSIVAYLAKENKSLLGQLKSIGKGEGDLLNECSCDINNINQKDSCTKEDHKVNRRAVFKVVKSFELESKD